MSEHGPSGPTGPAEPSDGAVERPDDGQQRPEASAAPGPQPYGSGPYPRTPYGPPAYGQSPYTRPYGQAGPGQPAPQPYWGPPRMQTTPVPTGYGTPPPAAPGASEPATRRTGRFRTGLAGLVAGALIGGAAGAGVVTLVDDGGTSGGSPAAAQNVVIENPESATTATAAAAKAAPSVVTIYVTGTGGSGSGSGVVLTEDGFVLTNNHVVAGEDGRSGTVQVRTSDGTLFDADVVGTDPASDLAVVRLDAEGLTPATFADSDDVQVGDIAVAIGAPLGLSNTVTDGIVSATGRAVATGGGQDEATVIDAIQTDAAINPGNSGGALVNGAGEVIGINTAIATVASGSFGGEAQSGNIGVGFAIPSNSAKRISDELMETGEATRAYLGVSARTASDGGNREVGSGAEVVSVESGTAAEDAGIEVGDVVTAVGDRPVTTSTELTAAVRSQAPGETVELRVRRDGNTRTIEVTLGSTS
ncbi:S1C family serine protease [Candidatus Blastococcus massiliensis]|uniref:S1C family serine protease n=1 Tax=Candidatus Blastococcus massiliensis TaxID=1470358 RepID=UPI0004BCF9FE|nr:trypsin-like peptidase domain-containing protein [Candidatus Blastococcus massiliensis]